MNLRVVDRDQTFVMMTSMREWVPADHIAWLVLDCVEKLISRRCWPSCGLTGVVAAPIIRR